MQKIEICDCLKKAIELHCEKKGIDIDWRLIDETAENQIPREYIPLLRITFKQWSDYLSVDDFISTNDTLKRKWTTVCNSKLFFEQQPVNGMKNAVLNLPEIKTKVPAYRDRRFDINLYQRNETDTRQTDTHTQRVIA